MTKLRVAVLMGGPSPEREVSYRSGQMVLKNLDPERYVGFPVEFDGFFGRPEALLDLKGRADFVFLGVHGKWGEDGTVQGMLEIMGIPYNGSGVLGGALAMNKVRSKAVYRELGIPQARSLDVRRVRGQWARGLSPAFGAAPHRLDDAALTALIGEVLGWDVILKGASQGSTLGLQVAKRAEDIAPALAELLAFDDEILIEERIAGVEVTAGVLGDDDALTALPLVEIRPKAGTLFDYEAKYTAGASEDLCPAPLDEALAKRIQALALRAHEGLACFGVSRSDFMIRDGEPYILETNTLPGLTENSLVPMAARAVGLMLPELFDQQIQHGLARHARRVAALPKVAPR